MNRRIVTLGLAGAAVLALSSCSSGTTSSAEGGRGAAPFVTRCQGTSPLGTLAALAPARLPADVARAGFTDLGALRNSDGVTYVAVGKDSSGSALVVEDASAASPLLTKQVATKVGTVNAQAADPKLHSCAMQLTDRPAARPYLRAAAQEAQRRRLGKAADLLSADAVDTISENPLKANSLIVTFQVPGARQTGAPKGAPALYDTKTIAVVVDRAGATVTAAGTVRW